MEPIETRRPRHRGVSAVKPARKMAYTRYLIAFPISTVLSNAGATGPLQAVTEDYYEMRAAWLRARAAVDAAHSDIAAIDYGHARACH